MPFPGSVGSLLRLLRERRWNALGATLSRGTFPAALFRWNVMFIFRLAGRVVLPERDRPQLRVRWGDSRDEGALQRIRPRAGGYEGNFARGHRLVIGEVEGLPVACVWLELGPVHVSRPNAYSFAIPRDGVWLYGTEIVPAFRGRGLFRLLYHGTLGLLAEIDRTRIYSAVERENVVALRANDAIGACRLWEYRVLRLAGLTWHDARPLAPGVGRRHMGVGKWSGADATACAAEAVDQLPVTR